MDIFTVEDFKENKNMNFVITKHRPINYECNEDYDIDSVFFFHSNIYIRKKTASTMTNAKTLYDKLASDTLTDDDKNMLLTLLDNLNKQKT